jgi:FAD/FMN-containing dehydrogenase/Fe-S oxidoreductase
MKQFREDLRKAIKGDVSFDDFTRGIYATDASIYQIMPVAVVLPRDEQDIINSVRIALKHNVSLVPRGGGTSLGGQATGNSLVLDLSKYMNRILEVNLRERWARVQPGIVLDELNAVLKQHGVHFAPDPATGNRATVGGMIGNNSSGTRSIVYGITRNHVLETKTLLSDGTRILFRNVQIEEHLEDLEKSNGREYHLMSGFKKIIDSYRDEIKARYPKIMRRVQGYNLDSFVNGTSWNMPDIITGSEGTLGVVLEAKIALEPLPKHRVLCTVHFAEFIDAIGSVSPVLEYGPSAVEILDRDLIMLAKTNFSIAPLTGWINGEPGGILAVEFFGETIEEARKKAETMVIGMQDKGKAYSCPVLIEPEEQGKVWAVRKNGLGILMGMQGERKPVAFIEDAAVPVEHLPDYIDLLSKFCKKRDVPLLMYAHASVGLLHVRPALNLKDGTDIDHMKAIARYSLELVKKFKGSISGEHGDGRTRSPFLEEYFGASVYKALKEVKQLFDPAGIMNPGVIVDAGPMDRDLRYGPEYNIPDIPRNYHYRENGNFTRAIEMCTGVGVCRQNLSGLMCPSYMATRDEEHSTRGRANALRLAISGQMGPEGMNSRELFEIMDLCLSCKGCKTECPSNVDVARLKGEYLQQYHEANGTKLRDRLVAGSTIMAKRMAGWKAPLVNGILKTMLFRTALQWIAGVDSRRIMPYYAKKSLHKWYAQRNGINVNLNKKVVLFDDTYMNYHETSVGISAVELLEACGYEVILARAGCCQRPRISHGFLKKARAEGEKTLLNLKRYIDEGLKIVVCEPGCASALTDDLPDLIDDEELAKLIQENVMMIDVFLAKEIVAGHIDTEFSSHFDKIVIHGHCHQKSLYGTDAMKSVLGRIDGLGIEVLDTGCCGMAGSFGYEKEHYEISMKVGEDRLFPALQEISGNTGLVACGFSCRHQIAHGTGLEAKHWVEVLRGEMMKD